MSDEAVRVALRIRPQSARERIDLCRICTSYTPGINQVVLGKDKAFTYDYVYDIGTKQDGLYKTCVENLVERCFDGYNATIMAYGQTGSGKTFTMGTGFDVDVGPADVGVVPRAVEHIFNGIRSRQLAAQEAGEPQPQYQLQAEFMELYNEEIVDLFDQSPESGGKKSLRIHEDAGRIFVAGMSHRTVTSAEQTMKALKEGALSRTTASTCMNAQSSRSHAIFTVHITQQRLISADSSAKAEESSNGSTQTSDDISAASTSSISDNVGSGGGGGVDFETLTAKLHFVDLAGSERLKRTGATGDRAREGISINCGLLALGNVISALGDKSKRASHVPYRDSKLTRLLQDSLGGNSQTLMIACISPSDRDFMETLNTLKYANRARNIKNKVTVNQDKASQQIAVLRAEIQRLSTELEEYRTGRRSVSEDGQAVLHNDQHFEISMLRAENDKMKLRLRALQETVDQQAMRMAQMQLKMDLPEELSGGQLTEGDDAVSKLVGRYLLDIENLKSQLLESESLSKVGPPASPFRRMSPCVSRTQSSLGGMGGPMPLPPMSIPEEVLHAARSDVDRLKEQQSAIETSRSSTSGSSRKSQRRKVKQSAILEKEEDGESSDEEPAEEDETVAISDNEAENGSDSRSDSSVSDDEDTKSLRNDLAELSSEISIKQRLIDQLQVSQQQLQSMRRHYEEQMLVLQTKIKETEVERDDVLTNLENRENTTEDQIKKVRFNFESKLKNLQSELGKMKTAKDEHHKLLRAKSRNEEKLRQLQTDLQEMKKQRVKMMRTMREESARNREQEARRAREIQQLKKASRKHESHIKSLEADRQRRDTVLKRKNEEVAMLRRQRHSAAPAAASRTAIVPSRSVSFTSAATAAAAAAGSAPLSTSLGRTMSQPLQSMASLHPGTERLKRTRRQSSVFSTTGGKKKWQRLERMVHDAVSQRQTLSSMEQDMDRLFSERDRLGHEVKECTRRKEDAIMSMEDDVSIRFQEEQLEALEAHLEFVQSNIDERQDEIMSLMESKDEGDTVAATGLLSSCSMKEARYLLDHFLHLAISSGLHAAQYETDAKELRGRLSQSEQQMKVREQMLLDFAGDSGPHTSSPTSGKAPPLNLSPIADIGKERPRSLSGMALDFLSPAGNGENTFVVPSPELLKEFTASSSRHSKPRRATATPAELLYPVKSMPPAGAMPAAASPAADDTTSPMSSLPMTSMLQPPSASLPSMRSNSIQLPAGLISASSESSLATLDDDALVKHRAKSFDTNSKTILQPSPMTVRKRSDLSGASELTSSLPSRLPRLSGDVFKRLTNDTATQPEVVHGSKRHGVITATTSRRSEKSQMLTCTHTAEGHSRPVLSVATSGTALFTGSQDRTAKIWDLQAGKEVVSLGGHASSVVAVCYAERTGLVFTAFQSVVKVWDIRDGQMKCIKLLGTTNSSGSGTTNSSEIVHDLCLSLDESYLYSTCGSAVRVWDLNKFQSIGKLVGSSAPVSTLLHLSGSHLSAEERGDSTLLATGARDHCVKIFEVNPKLANIQTACYQLEPPHYDGVQSLFEHDGQMYSGSRDHSIKQWDLANRQLRQSVNGAHNAWVSSLLKVQSSASSSQSSGVLASGCRSGMIKLWQLGTCAPVAEFTAHKQPINAMTANDGQIFSASSDRTVKVWKYRE